MQARILMPAWILERSRSLSFGIFLPKNSEMYFSTLGGGQIGMLGLRCSLNMAPAPPLRGIFGDVSRYTSSFALGPQTYPPWL